MNFQFVKSTEVNFYPLYYSAALGEFKNENADTDWKRCKFTVVKR